MRIADIKIDNYRGLKSIDMPLSDFGCLIGANNSGKSSVLQCISLVRSGTKLLPSDFYDPTLPVRIALTFKDVTEADLAQVGDEQQRLRFESVIREGELILVRTYEPETAKSDLRTSSLVPIDPFLRKDALKETMKGIRGAEMRAAVVELVPALDHLLEPVPTQPQVAAAVQVICDGLTSEELTQEDVPLPTGLDKSILPLLPEVVYIPAVKDVNDEIKTTDSATFGKLLSVLFTEIESEVAEIESSFLELQKKLSRVDGQDDARLPAVRQIEDTIQRYVQQNFPRVTLDIDVPAPELKTILRSAEITADDGFKGPIASKGDGLKRAVAFAILQTYAELRSGFKKKDSSPRYILLFEEPELYLHPQAQHQLFEALAVFARDNTVIVTTHSPLFFRADNTVTFSKLTKVASGDDAPITNTVSISLEDVGPRDQFQMIGFENNNAALFADHVVLVEGDSDMISLPHIASLLGEERSARHDVMFVRVSGKGSIERYRKFFEAFSVRVSVICDLDALFDGFDKLGATEEATPLRETLLQMIDERMPPVEEISPGSSLGDIRKGAKGQALWREAMSAHERWRADPDQWDQLEEAMSALFDRVSAPARLQVLQGSTDNTLLSARNALLKSLADDGVHVLSRGCIEDYYPASVTGSEKVSKAINFRTACTTRDSLDHHDQIEGQSTATDEFARVFDAIYGPVTAK